uniref:Uncharacterized protein n=1 Tax=Arundo donax TaxID=35708 RepID=A0A0A9FFW9_ARUDO
MQQANNYTDYKIMNMDLFNCIGYSCKSIYYATQLSFSGMYLTV